MIDDNAKRQEFEALVNALCDDQLTEREISRLAELMHENAEAQQRFMEIVHLDTSLRYWVGVEGRLQARALESFPMTLSKTSSDTKHPRSGVQWFSLAAALAGCLVVGWFLGLHSGGPDTNRERGRATARAEHIDGRMAVAGRILKFTPDSKWAATNLAVMRGTYVRPGQLLDLTRGVAEIEFGNSATAILQGPAKFEVKSDSEGYLYSGKVAIVGDIKSDGITLTTPSTQLHMKVGELGVTVDDEGVTDVQVLSGSLSAGLVTDNGSVIHQCSLSQGNGRRFDPSTALISKIGFTRYGYVLSVHESYVAYQNYLGSMGNQVFEGSLGMDFVVKDSIKVTKLGVFDSEANGLKRPLRAELWLRDEAGSAYRFDDDSGIKRIAAMDFTPENPGVLVESNRFKRLDSPIILPPGAYTIVASGYGPDEPNGNEGNPVYDRKADQVVVVPAWELGWRDVGLPIHALKSLDDGGAAILFVGSARWDEVIGQFPRVVDSGAVNRFQAGTFEFQRLDHSSTSDKDDAQDQPSDIESNRSI